MSIFKRPTSAERANEIESWALRHFDQAQDGLKAALVHMTQAAKEHDLAADDHRAAADEHDSLAEAARGSMDRLARVAGRLEELLS